MRKKVPKEARIKRQELINSIPSLRVPFPILRCRDEQRETINVRSDTVNDESLRCMTCPLWARNYLTIPIRNPKPRIERSPLRALRTLPLCK